MMEKMSLEHLENLRKLVDEMSYCLARVTGCLEAIQLIYPQFENSQDLIRFRQNYYSLMFGPSLRPAFGITLFSERIGEIIKEKENKNA